MDGKNESKELVLLEKWGNMSISFVTDGDHCGSGAFT
jgi:hypothetical protein